MAIIARDPLAEELNVFKMWKAFRAVKFDLKKLTGSHEKYYAVLGANGFEKSNQIGTRAEAIHIFKELKQAYFDELRLIEGGPEPWARIDPKLLKP